MFKIVKRFYDMGIYTNENIKKFVLSGKITAEQYAEITESNYEG